LVFFFAKISKAITWVLRSQTYKVFQSSMHVNGISVEKQPIFGYSSIFSPCLYFFFFFQVVNVVLQQLH
jgi:hypothetical protein